ncbi:MAG: hypothetical protein ABFS28_08115 [Bacteroidota bacterium]
MKTKTYLLYVAMLALSMAYTLNSAAQQIRIGEAELIYTDDEMPIRYDGSMSTINRDGKMHFFHSFGCRFEPGEHRRSRHSWHTGTPPDPLKVHLSSRTDDDLWNYNGYYRDMETEGIWILGMYRCDNGDLLAITHSEVSPAADKQGDNELSYSIGLGYSTDQGAAWTYCGEIITAANPHTNVGGGAYVIHDAYLYIYYNETGNSEQQRHPAVARAGLDAVLADASKHKVGAWMKYNDGQWNTPALSGTAGSSVIPIVYGGEDVHSDATYSTALGKYLLTVQTHLNNRLLLFSSENGVDWTQEAVVDVSGEKEMQPYSSFVDFDGPSADCSSVDHDFYIYYPRKNYYNHDHDYMFRRHITIE